MIKDAKFDRILKCGWKGLCPRCATGRMFTSWLKVSKTCPNCGLDYSFASPDDGPAFFTQTFICFPLIFVTVWIQVAFHPPFWVHVFTSIPIMLLGCFLALRPIKGWLIASQYLNRAQEAGTETAWAKLHGKARAFDD